MIDLHLLESDDKKSGDKEKDPPPSPFCQGFSKDSLEALYSTAYSYYQNGLYDDSIRIFRLLATMDPYEKKYWVGLGASCQQHKEYKNALKAYSSAAMIDFDDPAPHLHAAECYLSLENVEEALKALTIAEKCSLNSPCVNPKLVERIALMKNIWQTTKKES